MEQRPAAAPGQEEGNGAALVQIFAPGCLEEADAWRREQEEAGMALPRGAGRIFALFPC